MRSLPLIDRNMMASVAVRTLKAVKPHIPLIKFPSRGSVQNGTLANTSPDTSRYTYLGESRLSPVQGGFMVDEWEVTEEGQATIKVRFAVSRDGCIPVMEAFEGNFNGESINEKAMFTDVSYNVTIPDLLLLPPACNGQ